MRKLIIGTRGSKLALWQAHFTQDILADQGIETELKIIKTRGDQIQHLSFDKIEGKGFFTKEIEDALLNKEVDFAVHSMKDMPTSSPEGLVLTAVSYREDPSDWLIILKSSLGDGLLKLKENAIVGTSSARRKAQPKHFRPDISLKDIRGNVPTRIEKLKTDGFDAIILAGAGISRLEIDLSEFEVVKFNPKEFIPAPAQGVLVYQTREDDLEVRRILKGIHHSDVSAKTNVERKVLQLLDGGCHLPLGVYCEMDQLGNYHVWAAFSGSENAPMKYVKYSSSTSLGLAETVHKMLTDTNEH